MTRGHTFFSVLDGTGDIQPGATISVFQPGTTTLIPDTIWSADDNDAGAVALGNPFITADGKVSFFLATPQRVDLGITVPGQAQIIQASVDVSEVSTAGVNLSFPGTGTNSMQIGSGATATDENTVALGQAATASGDTSTAVGQDSDAAGDLSAAYGSQAVSAGLQSVAIGESTISSGTASSAVGQDAAASAASATALGQGALATAAGATAVGQGASVANTGSTAIGQGAVSSEDSQVMLGTPSTYADIPSFATIPSIPGGIKYRLHITDAGVIFARYHYPLDAVNLLTGVNSTFDGSIGAWTPGLNCTTTETGSFSQSGSGAMLIAQSASGQAYAQSPKVGVTANAWYVARIWMMQLSSGTATQFQAEMAFYNSGNTLIGSAALGPVQGIVSGYWTIVDVRVQAPGTAVTCSLFSGVPSGGSTGNNIYADTAGIFAVPQVI